MTIFDTPVLSRVLAHLSHGVLRIFGWRLEGCMPGVPRCVVIAAPHTSNWDLPVTLAFAFALGTKISWMGKDALFRRPFGGFFRWLGGIPVDRGRSNNVVARSVEVFREAARLVLVVPPEGTRRRVRVWKTGFYYIAHGAGVPIVLGFLDYRRKAGGIGPTLMPTGDIEADMVAIRAFYAGVTGKHPAASGAAEARARRDASVN